MTTSNNNIIHFFLALYNLLSISPYGHQLHHRNTILKVRWGHWEPAFTHGRDHLVGNDRRFWPASRIAFFILILFEWEVSSPSYLVTVWSELQCVYFPCSLWLKHVQGSPQMTRIYEMHTQLTPWIQWDTEKGRADSRHFPITTHL